MPRSFFNASGIDFGQTGRRNPSVCRSRSRIRGTVALRPPVLLALTPTRFDRCWRLVLGRLHIEIDRDVLSLRKAVQHAFERELSADAALLVSAVGMARRLAEALVDLHPPGFDRVRG